MSEEIEQINERETQNSFENSDSSENGLNILLGDIIKISAPSNTPIHESSFFVSYIDDSKIKAIQLSTLESFILNISEDGTFTDESITQIGLVFRSEKRGYALQNNLIPQTWIDIRFGGDIPVNITGEITNLEEDMIEVTTFPDMDVIYIDFEYKGFPENIPIENITIRKKPVSMGKLTTLEGLVDSEESEESEEVGASIEYEETGESVIRIPEDAEPDENIRDVLHRTYVTGNEIIFGENLEEIQQYMEIPESQTRYGIETQLESLLDNLLSTIPNSQRTPVVMRRVQLLLTRFKELRSMYSTFDKNQNVSNVQMKGALHKPLIERLTKMDASLKWILPVVSERRKIYNSNISFNDDIVEEKIEDSLIDQETVQDETYYKNRTSGDSVNYTNMHQQINRFMTNYEEPLNMDEIMSTVSVGASVEAIIENSDDFTSTAFDMSAGGIAKRKYVIQKYNLGWDQLVKQSSKNKNGVYVRAPMTAPDKMHVKSMILLPTPVMQHSRIDLPGTNIMEKSALHQQHLMLFRLLTKKTKILPYIVDDLSKEVKYDEDENQAGETQRNTFLKTMKQYVLSDEIQIAGDTYPQFLNSILPKTRTIIQLMRKYINDKLSFIDVVQYLEPFLIYPSDISFKQHGEIRYFIKEKIKDIKKKLVQKSKEFDLFKNTKYYTNRLPLPMLQLLSENKELEKVFMEVYDLPKKSEVEARYSSSEVLIQLMETDHNILFTQLLSNMMIVLMAPNQILNYMTKPDIDDMSDVEKIKAADCARRTLTKRYASIRDLQKDNNIEIFYDKEFDETPYGILLKYKDEQKNMFPEKFQDYLAEILIEKHDCPKGFAKELAKTLIAGKKTVVNDEYALVEIRPTLPSSVDESKLSEEEKESVLAESNVRMKYAYYKRIKNNWVEDKEIDDESFIDTNDLFCNMKNTCFRNKKAIIEPTCETSQNAAERLKTLAKDKAIKEFDRRYAMTVEEYQASLKTNMAEQIKYVYNLIRMNQVERTKYDRIARNIGNMALANTSMVSPHLKLRDLIFAQDDFVKKQSDIVRFVDEFCREPLVIDSDECPYWKYCKETNTKLMPMVLYELAHEFVIGGNYAQKQDELCHQFGTLSDNGDATVDKYSGYVIKKKDFVSEDSYGDEPDNQLSSYSFMETANGKKKSDRVFETELSELIYRIYSAICRHIDIPVDSIDDFVMRNSTELIQHALKSEASYQKILDKAKSSDKVKNLPSYSMYRHETIILCVTCILFVGIQTVVPGFKNNKTFAGCVRSFTGFPMTGEEDLTGLQYISCVLEKTTKSSSIEPWNSIKSLKVSALKDRLKQVIDKYVLNNPVITDKYREKKEYLLLNPEEVIPDEHNISKWVQFQPPVVPVDIIKSLRNVSSDFKKDFMELIRKGDHKQWAALSVFKSKCLYYTFGIIEAVHKIVQSKDLLLKTSSKNPFLENSCCNESLVFQTPIAYFIKENAEIEQYIKIASRMGLISQDIAQLSRAPMLYHPRFTGLRFPINPDGYIEENIYSAIIHYCNLDNKHPVPPEFKGFFSEKPATYKYKPADSIQDKMEFLKKMGKNFTPSDLHSIMKIVNARNLVRADATIPPKPVKIIQDILQTIDVKNSTIISPEMRELLYAVLGEYNPNARVSEDSEDIRNLRRYLSNTNQKIFNQITLFFNKYGNLEDSELTNINNTLSSIHQWNMNADESASTHEGYYNVIQFIRNSIFNMSKVYPNCILNNAQFNRIPSHWGLSDFHKKDVANFIQKFQEPIAIFKQDKTLGQILREIQNILVDLNLFTQNIPVYAPVKVGAQTEYSLFDQRTTYLLFLYCFYSTIYEYVVLSDDRRMLSIDVETMKDDRREQIREQRNPLSQIQSAFDMLDESEFDQNDDLETVHITTGNTQDLKKRVASLLLSFLNIERENKKAFNYSYQEIASRTHLAKEKEKKGITTALGEMAIDERKVENIFKKYKIGKWNVGLQKGLVKYDKSTYDRERETLLEQIASDVKSNLVDNVTQNQMDIYELNEEDEREIDAVYDAEATDIQHLSSNYDDGQYYSDDDEDRDFGEDD